MIVQLLQVRKILESWAAAEASRQATDEDLRALEAVYQDLERDFRNNELGVDADVRRVSVIDRPENRAAPSRYNDLSPLTIRVFRKVRTMISKSSAT